MFLSRILGRTVHWHQEQFVLGFSLTACMYVVRVSVGTGDGIWVTLMENLTGHVQYCFHFSLHGGGNMVFQAMIRKELNEFKSTEMDVHEESRQFTRLVIVAFMPSPLLQWCWRLSVLRLSVCPCVSDYILKVCEHIISQIVCRKFAVFTTLSTLHYVTIFKVA